MKNDPETFVAIGAAASPTFSRDGQTLFHLRGSGLPQVWALDLATGADRQLTFHDEKVAQLRRSPVDDRLIHGIDRGGDERQQLLLIDPNDASPVPRELAAGTLVKAFDVSLPGYCFYVVRKPGHPREKTIQAFSTWLQSVT